MHVSDVSMLAVILKLNVFTFSWFQNNMCFFIETLENTEKMEKRVMIIHNFQMQRFNYSSIPSMSASKDPGNTVEVEINWTYLSLQWGGMNTMETHRVSQ